MEAFIYLKIAKAPGSFEVYVEMILANGDVGIDVDGTLPEYTRWKRSASRLRYLCCNSNWNSNSNNGKGDIMNCGMYRGVKLQVHA